MSQHAHTIKDAALNLDPVERLELANLLIDSVEDGNQDESWTTAWTLELKRRSAAADARLERGRPWKDVRAHLLEKLARK